MSLKLKQGCVTLEANVPFKIPSASSGVIFPDVKLPELSMLKSISATPGSVLSAEHVHHFVHELRGENSVASPSGRDQMVAHFFLF